MLQLTIKIIRIKLLLIILRFWLFMTESWDLKSIPIDINNKVSVIKADILRKEIKKIGPFPFEIFNNISITCLEVLKIKLIKKVLEIH